MSSAPPPQLQAPTPPGSQRPPEAGEAHGAELWLAPVGVLLGFAAALFFTLVIEIAGAAGGSSLGHPSPAVNLAASYVFDLSFVGVALYLTLLHRRMGAADFGYLRGRWKLAASGFVAAGLVYYGVSWAYTNLLSLHGTDKLPSDLGVHRSTAALIAAAVFVCVVAPICEEFFFRGFLFGVLRRMRISVAGRQLGPWVAAVIVAIVFGAAHYGSAPAEYLIPLGFLGFLLCLVRWRTGSLYPCMALHSFNNALALGVSELGWSAGATIALMAGSIAVVAALTLPLGVGAPAVELPGASPGGPGASPGGPGAS